MAYFRLKFIKDKLHLSQDTDEGLEDELKQIGAEADAWVDDNLKDLLTVPVASPSEQIKTLSEYYAAGLYQARNQGDPNKKPYYLTKAEQDLETMRQRILEAGENTKKGSMLGKTKNAIILNAWARWTTQKGFTPKKMVAYINAEFKKKRT